MFRRDLSSWFIAVYACTFLIWSSSLCSAQNASSLRVLSYNVHHCRGLDEKVDLPRIAKIITDCKPDLVALQEIDNKTRRTGSVDQTQELAQLTGMHGLFFKAIDFEGGGYGQAILSKAPLSEPQTVKLPNRSGREQRIVGWVTTEIHGQSVRFGTTHLDHADQAIRLEQAQQIASGLTALSQPSIIAGDFNASPESKEIAELSKSITFAKSERPTPSFPAERPTKQIDYIGFASLHRTSNGGPKEASTKSSPTAEADSSGSALKQIVQFRVVSFEVLDQPLASDHRPILAVLELVVP